jgi:MFS-type transporter involved in bile tolerance (Atg22 family)
VDLGDIRVGVDRLLQLLGEFAAVFEPLTMGLVAVLTGNQRLSILVLAVFFVAGGLLLWRVPRVDAPWRG